MLNHSTVGAAPSPMSAPDRQHHQPWAARLRLAASPMVNTAGLVEWACVGFDTERARGGHLAPFIALLANGYGLGIVLAERVLRGEIMTLTEHEEVVLLLDAENARIFDMEQRTAAAQGMLSRDLPVDVEVDGQPARRTELTQHFCNEARPAPKSVLIGAALARTLQAPVSPADDLKISRGASTPETRTAMPPRQGPEFL